MCVWGVVDGAVVGFLFFPLVISLYASRYLECKLVLHNFLLALERNLTADHIIK